MCVQASFNNQVREGFQWRRPPRLIRPPTVTGDGEGPVSHAGLVWLGEVADRSGLTVGFSQVLASAPRRRRDPGVTLVQLAIVSTDLPAGMPPAAALPRDVQLAGDLGLGATLGRQFGGAFPAGLAGGAVR